MATVASLRGKELRFDFLEKITDDFSKERELGTGPLRTTVYKVYMILHALVVFLVFPRVNKLNGEVN